MDARISYEDMERKARVAALHCSVAQQDIFRGKHGSWDEYGMNIEASYGKGMEWNSFFDIAKEYKCRMGGSLTVA